MDQPNDRILGEGDAGIPKQSPKIYVAAAVFLTTGFGVALGGFVSYDHLIDQRAQGLVFGQYEEFNPVSAGQLAASSDNSFDALLPITPINASITPVPVPVPIFANIPSPTPSPSTSTSNPCKIAFNELETAKVKAETQFNSAQAESKSAFDAEQKNFTAQLTEYSKQRVAAINNYLGQIAIATSKYNQSADTHAYDTYKKEQGEAFNLYSQAISKIDADEALVVEQKKQSENKYNAAVTATQNKLNAELVLIQNNYQTQTAGKNCGI